MLMYTGFSLQHVFLFTSYSNCTAIYVLPSWEMSTAQWGQKGRKRQGTENTPNTPIHHLQRQ